MTEARLFHFTSAEGLVAIKADGSIDPQPCRNGTELVWLLDEERCAPGMHGIGQSASLRPVLDRTRIRIEVNAPDAFRWLDWLAEHGLPGDPLEQDRIEDGGGRTAAAHWWVCLQPIPSGDWVSVTSVGDMTLDELEAAVAAELTNRPAWLR